MVVISDLHLGKIQDTVDRSGLPSRLHDTMKRVREAISYAAKRKESLVMAGDIFDSASPSPLTISVFFELLQFAKDMKVSVYIIPGNHDCGVRYHSMMYLNEKFRLDTNMWLVAHPAVLMVENMKVLFLPHVPKAEVDVEGYQEYVLGKISKEDSKNIEVVIGHAHIKGASNASDVELEAGEAVNFNPSGFFKYELGVFGHIHKHQLVGKNVYCGPVCTNSFDEAKLEKGFVHVNDSLWEFIPYTVPETQYAIINIDLVNKDSVVYDEKKMDKHARDKILKIVVYARDMMQVDQTEIKKNFDRFGTVVRFEIVLRDKYSGTSEDEDIEEVFESINYKPVFKAWIDDKKDLTEGGRKMALKVGYAVIEEVLNASRD
jgi:DNA repair exonuclease SbcCD nuclease subunit